MARRNLQVDAAAAGMRLDRYLRDAQIGLSRQALELLFRDGQVSCNGRLAKKGDRVAVGDRITFDPAHADVIARPAPADGVRVVLVTDELVVIDKPAGVPSSAVPGRVEGTAAGQLLTLFPEVAQVGYGPREPGLLHRLDTQTSGLLLAARTPLAFSLLQEELRAGHLTKKYQAIVHGAAPESGQVELGLEPDPADARRVRPTTRDRGARVTAFRCLEQRGEHSLLEVTLARGYRHQIRAHMASLGFPLVGDVLYGGPAEGLAPRHALHASYIAADSGALRFRAESELPSDLLAFWSGLGAAD